MPSDKHKTVTTKTRTSTRPSPINPTPKPRAKTHTNDAWKARALAALPWGVSSNFRYWEGEQIVAERAKGTYMWDADGKRYIDYRLGFGPIILGHAHDEVTDYVAEQMRAGNLFSLTSTVEVRAAEAVKRLTGMDKVRFTNSGTESMMHAVRIARGNTNRELLIKFEGGYHGSFDYAMWTTPGAPLGAMGSSKSPNPVASSSGIPRSLYGMTLTLPVGNVEMLEKTLKERGHQVAAILVEPIMMNIASLNPGKHWLHFIRRMCDEYGIVMIMDEVKTGFRVARGGAQEYFGVRADIVAYAKAMGNGFPVGAIAGKESVMMSIERGAIGQGGTYCGNMVAVAACEKTLEILEREDVIGTIGRRGRRLMDGICDVLHRKNVPVVVSGVPQCFGVVVGTDEMPKDYRSLHSSVDHALSRQLTKGLRQRGVLPDPDFQEPWFLCYALSEADVDETLNVLEDVADGLVG
jgi:glutamate-1-semialdehyde 2,1-aminomutase